MHPGFLIIQPLQDRDFNEGDSLLLQNLFLTRERHPFDIPLLGLALVDL
jgi:hypothetical protein